MSEPTWVTMMLPSRLTLRPESAALVANSPEHHDADEDRADDDAGQAEREDDLAKHAPETGAEVARGLEDIRVDAAEHEGDRPDHEDDIDLRHADDDREIGEQQRLDRLVR